MTVRTNIKLEHCYKYHSTDKPKRTGIRKSSAETHH